MQTNKHSSYTSGNFSRRTHTSSYNTRVITTGKQTRPSPSVEPANSDRGSSRVDGVDQGSFDFAGLAG